MSNSLCVAHFVAYNTCRFKGLNQTDKKSWLSYDLRTCEVLKRFTIYSAVFITNYY